MGSVPPRATQPLGKLLVDELRVRSGDSNIKNLVIKIAYDYIVFDYWHKTRSSRAIDMHHKHPPFSLIA